MINQESFLLHYSWAPRKLFPSEVVCIHEFFEYDIRLVSVISLNEIFHRLLASIILFDSGFSLTHFQLCQDWRCDLLSLAPSFPLFLYVWLLLVSYLLPDRIYVERMWFLNQKFDYSGLWTLLAILKKFWLTFFPSKLILYSVV